MAVEIFTEYCVFGEFCPLPHLPPESPTERPCPAREGAGVSLPPEDQGRPCNPAGVAQVQPLEAADGSHRGTATGHAARRPRVAAGAGGAGDTAGLEAVPEEEAPATEPPEAEDLARVDAERHGRKAEGSGGQGLWWVLPGLAPLRIGDVLVADWQCFRAVSLPDPSKMFSFPITLGRLSNKSFHKDCSCTKKWEVNQWTQLAVVHTTA